MNEPGENQKLQVCPIKVTEEDEHNIESFYRSPVYSSFCKLLEANVWSLTQEMIFSDDMNKVRDMQGRIKGMRTLENLPMLISQMKEKVRKAEKVKQDRQVKAPKQREL